MREELRQELGLAIPLLLKIRAECCDGRINIPQNNLNNIAMNILKRLDLVKCRNLEREQKYYVGVSDKGRTVCQLLGAY